MEQLLDNSEVLDSLDASFSLYHPEPTCQDGISGGCGCNQVGVYPAAGSKALYRDCPLDFPSYMCTETFLAFSQLCSTTRPESLETLDSVRSRPEVRKTRFIGARIQKCREADASQRPWAKLRRGLAESPYE